MKSMKVRLAIVVSGLGVMAASGTVAPAAGPERATARSAPIPTAVCSEVIGREESGALGMYRVILRSVSVPPAFQRQVFTDSTSGAPWRYFQKIGFGVRSGSPAVIVTVPKAWRARVAIDWGGTGTASQVKFAACPNAADLWNYWAGGFHLRNATACVPLQFKTGPRTATVYFGVGKRCG